MRLGTTSLSVTRPGAVRKYAAADVNFADISDYSHTRFDRINVATGWVVTGVAFNPTGTIVFTLDSTTSTRPIKSQTLSTAWDISTAGSTTATFNTYDSSGFTNPAEVRFKSDGTKMYVNDTSGNIREYTLQSSYSLTNVGSYTAQRNFGTVHGFDWKPDGTALYTIDRTSDRVKKHALATAWDITSTITLTQSIELDLPTTANETDGKSLAFSPDGLKLYITGVGLDKVQMYNLSTAWDITSFSGTPDDTLDISSQETAPQVITFSDDGKHLYVGGAAGLGVDQYSRP